MTKSLFFRLLDSPIDSKGADLLQQIAQQNQGEQLDKTFPIDPDDFSSIPGSPFAYWASNSVRSLYTNNLTLKKIGVLAQHGASSKNDPRFLRLWWEVSVKNIGENKKWVPFAKGGEYSCYFSDIHLIILWENNAQEIKDYVTAKYPYLNGETGWILHPENSYYHSGITWTRRTSRNLSVRALPEGTIFSDKGPSAFTPKDNKLGLSSLLALMNSKPFMDLLSMQLGAADTAARSYEVGLVQQTPIPIITNNDQIILSELSLKCHNLALIPFVFEETTHVFCRPMLLSLSYNSLPEKVAYVARHEANRQAQLTELQEQIDRRVAELYGLDDKEKVFVGEVRPTTGEAQAEDFRLDAEEEEEDEASLVLRPSTIVSDLLMWCVGVAFGRWDVRFALQPDLLPALAGPFDPLPRCSPGMLLSPDGLPATKGNIVSEAWLRARPDVLTLPETVDGPQTIADQDYPLPIAWDGILVDDPDHPRDIVTAVRRVLRLIWKEQADAIEKEACQILEVPDLRAYFRDARLFFNDHIKRYSKSRRKAPIYWLLQSVRRNYGIWLYYPRLNPDMLFSAGREYMDAKLNLETGRLQELKTSLAGLVGTNLKMRERQVSRQADLIGEIKAFGKELDRVALLELKPDLNDGVLLNIAPLYNLVPWKEAEKASNELASGKYEWSSIGQQLRQKGWVKK